MPTQDTDFSARLNVSYEASGLKEASRILQEALLTEKAQSLWIPYLPQNIKNSPPVLSYRAIARAISELENKKYGVDKTPNHYKDRVRRAILGQRLTLETLTIFAETFGFSNQVVEKISTALCQDYKSPVLPDSNHARRPHFNISSSFYDLYINEDLHIYKMDISVVIRAVGEVQHLWAEKSDDILNLKLLEGGKSIWVEEAQAWKLILDYPLAPTDSTEIRYLIEINTEVAQKGLVCLRYALPRPTCFYRIFFEQPEKAPKEITLSRYQRNAPDKLIASRDVPVFGGRASLYLDEVGQEILIFSAKDDA